MNVYMNNIHVHRAIQTYGRFHQEEGGGREGGVTNFISIPTEFSLLESWTAYAFHIQVDAIVFSCKDTLIWMPKLHTR